NDNSAWLREGYTFSGWTVAGIDAEDIADGTFQMPDTNVVFSAEYERITHTVTVTAEDPAHVTTAGAGTYNWGDAVTVTATPAKGYMVTGIYEDDTLVSSGAVFTIDSLTEDRTFRVTVAEKMSTITITAHVDTVNFANGDPIFVYAVTSDRFSAVATVRITAGTSGSTTLNVPFGSYTVSTEDAALRYTADEGSMDPQMITVSTTDAYTADFSYHRTTATHFSSTDVVTNTITLSDKFVGGGTTQPQPDNSKP
ncbi:MAG: hypothetical protein RR216_06285, partial [Pseudoflavonifractor sp.]